jgi:hypothetical protein
MTADKQTLDASYKIIVLLQQYCEVLARQTEASQKQMDSSTFEVMNAIYSLSQDSEKRKNEAEKLLEETYLAPTGNASELFSSVQSSTDDIFEQATLAITDTKQNLTQVEDKSVDMRRLAGKFSKNMESLSTFDESIKSILLSMTGVLSNNDVISQKLEHIVMAIRAMHVGLANILVDIDDRLTEKTVKDFNELLLSYTYRTYTMESERDLYKTFFNVVNPIKDVKKRSA